MITKIRRLKNIGKFYDFSAKGDGLDWQKNTFLYAPNAYGKSTLVSVCQSVRNNNPKIIYARKTLGSVTSPEAVIIIDGVNHVYNGRKWDKKCPDIQIFDMPFIHANILSNEIEHEHRKNLHRIIIGAAGIKLAEELSALKTKERNKRQQFEAFRTEFNRGAYVHHTLDAFLAIPATEEADVTARIGKLDNDIKSKETETQVRALGAPSAIAILSFDLSATKTLATKKLAAAHEEAEKVVLEHIDKNISGKNRAKQFIRQGLDLLQADCPFCGQDLKIAADLLEAYREFFDDAFRTFQTELSLAASTLDNWNVENELTALVSSHNANTATVKQWEPHRRIGLARCFSLRRDSQDQAHGL
jgi:wobble nucleotide-excising tRNase